MMDAEQLRQWWKHLDGGLMTVELQYWMGDQGTLEIPRSQESGGKTHDEKISRYQAVVSVKI